MELVKYEMDVPKESKEIIDALELLAKHLTEKKPLAELSLLLPSLMTAFEGYSMVAEEVSGEYRDELLGYMTHKLGAVLLKKKEAQVETPAQ